MNDAEKRWVARVLRVAQRATNPSTGAPYGIATSRAARDRIRFAIRSVQQATDQEKVPQALAVLKAMQRTIGKLPAPKAVLGRRDVSNRDVRLLLKEYAALPKKRGAGWLLLALAAALAGMG